MSIRTVSVCASVCALVAASHDAAALASSAAKRPTRHSATAKRGAHSSRGTPRSAVWTLAEHRAGKLHTLKAATHLRVDIRGDVRLREEKENSAGYKYAWDRHLVCDDTALYATLATNKVPTPELSLVNGSEAGFNLGCVEEAASHTEWREGYFEAWGVAGIRVLYLPWKLALESTPSKNPEASVDTQRYFEIEVNGRGVICKYFYLPDLVHVNVTSPQLPGEFGPLAADFQIKLAQANRAAGCPQDGAELYLSLTAAVEEGGVVYAKLE